MLDDYLDALANEHRRELLVALLDRDEVAVFDVVSRPGTDPERNRMEVRHVHLPKLEACGLVDWHRGADTVSAGPNLAAVRPLVETVARLERSLE